MMITEIEQSTQHEPIANEAERRLKELQMMDLGTQRREYITTVDAPSKYKNVTLQEIEASRRANVDPKIKSMAEANKQRLSAWNNVHETLGGDVDIEDLDSLMDGQSHRARLCDLVREQGGQRYVEPEPLFNGHYHHSSPSRPNGKPSRPNGKPSSFRKRGKVAITNAAGRTRKALPRLGKYIVELPPAPGKASSLSSKPPGKKKSKPTVVSQLDPAKNPALMPAQPPINAVTALRTGNSPKPPSVASSTDTKASKVSQYKLRRTVTRPPRVATGPSVYPTDMADPNDFMKAVEAAMPVDKITRSPTIATAAATSSVATTTIPSSPVSSSASRRSFLVVDDPTTLMMKAASIVAKPGESLAVSSATNGLIDQLHAPETTKDMSTSSVGNIQVGSVAHQGSLKQSVTVPEDIGAQVDTQHEESTQTTIMSGQVGQTQESVSREAPTPVYEARNHQVCNYPKPLIGNGNMSNLQEGTMSKTATAPTADLLDLDFDDTPVDPTPRPPRPSLCLGMMPFTPPPPKTPALQTPHSSQSITPKQNRALEAYLRIFVRFRVELRKIRQLAKKTATDDDLQRYLEQRKQEIEEDYHILWEELTEHYPDIDLDEIEEEVLIRSLTVRIKILDADLDHYRKKHEEAKHQIEPMTQPKPIARREGLNTVSTIITPSTHEVLTLSSLPLIAPEPVTSTAPAAQTVNPAAESCTKKPQAPVLTPSSVRTQIECRANNGANAPIGGSDFPGRLHNRSPTTASVTPSMTSDFFHPGRTSANVPGLQSERAPFASIADHDFTPATPAQAASASYVPSQNTSLLEQLLPATTSADVIKPLYQPPQTDLSSFPHCDYNAANRYSSMTIIGYTSPLAATSSQPYQGLGNLSMNVRMPELGQPRTLAVRQPPATGLQASRWAIAPPIATNHAQTRPSSTQIEMFTANLQPHEITLKPRNGKSSNLQVSGLTSKMDKLNGLDKPSQGSEANVRSHENNKPPTPPCQPQLQKNFVGLSASKWAS